MHKEKSAFPQSPGIRARLDYIISAHIPEVKEYTTISQELEHLQGWGLHITQHSHLMRQPCNSSYLAMVSKVPQLHTLIPHILSNPCPPSPKYMFDTSRNTEEWWLELLNNNFFRNSWRIGYECWRNCY